MADVNRAAAVKRADRCRWIPFLQGRSRWCARSRIALGPEACPPGLRA
ncbi:hypothetical protein SCE1572_02830 [Sorangium cellulosum So0157-2]|uniref:Uncharacterized protein n=1 Tax=Sorangium cellulosum So0157-2 TaxID=1254432 RepID=S4XSG9_SORCE|nr:hypothetical protein SCE1572_02830 [Sorangium cellulosum So0157-2]